MSQTSPTSEQSKVVKGLEGVYAAQTDLSKVDGEASQLYYRGIPVHELVAHSSFEEVAYFLWYGKLPKLDELEALKKSLAGSRELPADMWPILKGLPKNAHPMAVLRTLISALGLYDPDGNVFDAEVSQRQALKLTALTPVMIAAYYRLRDGKDPVPARKDLSEAANFLYMMHGKEAEPEMVKALDAYLILLADHGLNASTFSARVTVATQSDLYSAITSAVGTLKGDLHGSANQRAMEMLEEIKTPENAESYIKGLLEKKKKVMGFGHRIYKEKDPRAEAFRQIARNLCRKSDNDKWLKISDIVEKVMWDTKKIPCNVDFFSATVLYILGFPIDFFTTVFATSRMVGWTAHVIEQQRDNRLIRPKAQYTGPAHQNYTAIGNR